MIFSAEIERAHLTSRGDSRHSPHPRSAGEFVRSVQHDYFSIGGILQTLQSTITYLAPVIAIGSIGAIAGGRFFQFLARRAPQWIDRSLGLVSLDHCRLGLDELFSACLWTSFFRSRQTGEDYIEATSRDVATGIISRALLTRGIGFFTTRKENPFLIRFLFMPALMAVGGWFAEVMVESGRSVKEIAERGSEWEIASRFLGASLMMHGQSNLLRLFRLHADDWGFVRREMLKTSIPFRIAQAPKDKSPVPVRRQLVPGPVFMVAPAIQQAFGRIVERGGDPEARKTPINYEFLARACEQQGPWKGKTVQMAPSWYLREMKRKIQSIDWNAAKKEVSRFLRGRSLQTLELWSEKFFLDRSPSTTLLY